MEQAIHVGRLDVGIANRTERIRPLIIGENEDNIGTLGRSRTWPSDRSEQNGKSVISLVFMRGY